MSRGDGWKGEFIMVVEGLGSMENERREIYVIRTNCWRRGEKKGRWKRMDLRKEVYGNVVFDKLLIARNMVIDIHIRSKGDLQSSIYY